MVFKTFKLVEIVAFLETYKSLVILIFCKTFRLEKSREKLNKIFDESTDRL